MYACTCWSITWQLHGYLSSEALLSHPNLSKLGENARTAALQVPPVHPCCSCGLFFPLRTALCCSWLQKRTVGIWKQRWDPLAYHCLWHESQKGCPAECPSKEWSVLQFELHL